MQPTPSTKLASYFNVDNGTGLIRGVYLQGNEAVAPIFQAWMEPFKNLGMTTLSIRNKAAPIISPTMRSGCRAFSSSRTVGTTRGRTTRTWT
jgi:hypothetical protein